MKKFKFRLDGLLKLRELKEKKIKIEMGEILSEISHTEDLIHKMKNDIQENYQEEQALLSSSTSGELLQFFPYYREGRKEDIKGKESLLYSLRRKYDRKLQELNEARGDVKVIENLKEKKKEEHKKEFDKKLQENIDDILIMQRHQKNGV